MFRNTILYGREIVTLNQVYDALFSKMKMKQYVDEPIVHGQGPAI